MKERCLGCMNEYDASFDVCPHCGYIKGTPARSRNHLEPGTMLIDRYLLGRCLGQGGFGITYIAWDTRLYKKVAIKEFMPTSLASRITGQMEITCYNEEAQTRFHNGILRMLDESRRLARFNDLESVVKVYDCFEANGTAYIIMELLDGENIKDILEKEGKFDLNKTIEIMTPVLLALREIHASHLIHRDISPDNIFLCRNGKVKLLDFGSARVASGEDGKSLSVILKPGYAPKEQYSGNTKQGPFTDVYAVCATIYKMLTGVTPIDSLARDEADDPLEEIDTLASVPHGMACVIMDGMALEAKDRPQTVDPLLDVFDAYRRGETPPKTPRAGKRRGGNAKKAVVQKLWIVFAVAAVLAGAAFGLHHWLAPHDDPLTEPVSETETAVSIDTQEYTPYQLELLETASLETLPTDDLPQPDARGRIESKYAASMEYSADAGSVFVLYADGGRVLLREQIALPRHAVERYTLYTYTDDGQIRDEVTYLCSDVPEGEQPDTRDDTVESAERSFFNKDGTLFTKSTYDGTTLMQRESYFYNTDGTPAVMTLWENGTQTGTANYTYDSTAVRVTQKDANGNKVYECKTYTSDGRVDETWFAADGEVSKTIRREMQDGRLVRYSETGYGRTECVYTWNYDPNGKVIAHTVGGRDGKRESAVRFVYDEEDVLQEIRLYDENDDLSLAYKSDGAYTEYAYIGKGLMRLRAEYDAQGKPVSRIVTEYDEDDVKTRTTYYDEKDKVEQYYIYEGAPGEHAYSRTLYSADGTMRKLQELDAKDEVWRETEYDPAGHETAFRYYEDGKITIETISEYSGDNLIMRKRYADGELQSRAEYEYSGGSWREQRLYDAYGNLEEKIEYNAVLGIDRYYRGNSGTPYKREAHNSQITEW